MTPEARLIDAAWDYLASRGWIVVKVHLQHEAAPVEHASDVFHLILKFQGWKNKPKQRNVAA